jgi:hypothetical protein
MISKSQVLSIIFKHFPEAKPKAKEYKRDDPGYGYIRVAVTGEVAIAIVEELKAVGAPFCASVSGTDAVYTNQVFLLPVRTLPDPVKEIKDIRIECQF